MKDIAAVDTPSVDLPWEKHPYIVAVQGVYDSRWSNYDLALETAYERGGEVILPPVRVKGNSRIV